MNGFIGGACILVSAISALVGVFLRSRARKQLAWEGVDGTVCAASVIFDGEDYRPRIEYAYSYHGRALRGAKVRSPAAVFNWRGPAERVVAKYRPGSAVTVFVNPENPGESVLERGGDPKFFLLMLFLSVLFLIFGVLLLRNPGGGPLAAPGAHSITRSRASEPSMNFQHEDSGHEMSVAVGRRHVRLLGHRGG